MLGFPGVMNPMDINQIYSESVGYQPMHLTLVVHSSYCGMQYYLDDVTLVLLRYASGLERRIIMNIINE